MTNGGYDGTPAQRALIREFIMLSARTKKVRVTLGGEVHVYGVMPNTSKRGWYIAGSAAEIFSSIRGFS